MFIDLDLPKDIKSIIIDYVSIEKYLHNFTKEYITELYSEDIYNSLNINKIVNDSISNFNIFIDNLDTDISINESYDLINGPNKRYIIYLYPFFNKMEVKINEDIDDKYYIQLLTYFLNVND